MSEKNKELSMSTGMFFELMFLMFLGLKISGLIDWSWWWVFAPIWVPIGIFLCVLGLIGLYLVLTKAKNGGKK